MHTNFCLDVQTAVCVAMLRKSHSVFCHLPVKEASFTIRCYVAGHLNIVLIFSLRLLRTFSWKFQGFIFSVAICCFVFPYLGNWRFLSSFATYCIRTYGAYDTLAWSSCNTFKRKIGGCTLSVIWGWKLKSMAYNNS